MADADKPKTERKRARRPRIPDLLDVCWLVKHTARERGISERKLLRDRNFEFDGAVTMRSLERSKPCRPLRGESLRRRVREAHSVLGLTPLPEGFSDPAYDEFRADSLRFLEELRAVFG